MGGCISSVPSAVLGCNTSLFSAVGCDGESFAALWDAIFLLITLPWVIFRLCWSKKKKKERQGRGWESANNVDARAKNHFLGVFRDVNVRVQALHAYTYRH